MTKYYRGWWVIAIVALVCLFGLVLGFVLDIWYEYAALVNGLIIGLVFLLAFSAAAIVFFAVKIGGESIEPDRFLVTARNEQEFFLSLQNKLLHDEFKFHGRIENPFGDIVLYVRQEFWGYDCYMLLRTHEYTEELEASYGTLFWETLTEAYPDADQRSELDVSLVSLTCVDEMNQLFEARMGKNLTQAPGRYHLPAGVCFSDMTVYVPVQKGGSYRTQYKRLKGDLLRYL